MRIIGLDIHRAFAEAVAWQDGKLKRLGRIDMRRDLLAAFAGQLSPDDIVVVEATGNAAAVAAVIAPHVKQVVIANPKQVRLIARAKIKTDTIDAGVLAQLYASGFLPEVWVADEPTQALRRQVTRRNQIVRQRSRLKNIIQPILHAHLVPSCPHADLCGAKGRDWLVEQVVPEDERTRSAHTRAQTPALLKGLIVGPTGCAMTPTHTRRRGRLYRYCVRQTVLKQGTQACPVRRVPAGQIEAAVVDQLRAVFRQPEMVVGTWRQARAQEANLPEAEVRLALQRLDPLWDELFPAEQARIVQLLVDRVDVSLDGIDIRLRVEGLEHLVGELAARQTRRAA